MPDAVTLADLLKLRTAGLTEPEIWSLLCQGAQALQDVFLAKKACENVPRVSPNSLWLTSRGRVILLPDCTKFVPCHVTSASGDHYLAPEYSGSFQNANEVDIEKMWIYSLGQSLKDAVLSREGQLNQPLENLLTAMIQVDPLKRATLMDVLNVISDFCKLRLDCKPFSHVAMDLYREMLDILPHAPLCLSNIGSNTSHNADKISYSDTPKPKTVKMPGIGKSCSLRELHPPHKNGVHRVPSHLYRVASSVQDMPRAKYTCPNMCIGPEFIIRASSPSKIIHFNDKKTNQTQKVVVILLDGQRLTVYCDPAKVTARQLFEVIMQVEKVEENFFLGLTVLLNGDLFFLCPDTRLSKVIKPKQEKNKVLQTCNLTLYLRIKFFLPSLRGVCKWASKHLLYLQLRRCLLEEQIRCEVSDHIALGGLALQAEFGDYNVEDHGGDYFLLEHYIPESLISNEQSLKLELREQHQRRLGLDPGRAEEMHIALAQSLNAYGLHFYAVTCVRKNNTRCDMWLAVGSQGILLYNKRGNDREFNKLYVWKNIEKLCYNKQYFMLYPRSDVKGIIPVKYKFQLDKNKCLFVFYLASQHHQFFLKLRIELSSLHSLSQEFGVSLSSLSKKNKKLFYVENQPVDTPLSSIRELVPSIQQCSRVPVSASTSCLETSVNIEEHQNKENEQPGVRRLSVDVVVANDSLKSQEQHSQCLPYSQYTSDINYARRMNYKNSSFPRRHRVKMGTKAFSSIPKDLSSQHALASAPRMSLSPAEAYVLNSSIKSTDETFHIDMNESLSESLLNKFDSIPCSNERILKTMTVRRDEHGSLGIQITEGSDGGVYIQSTNLTLDSSLHPGDQLIAVDGHSLLQMKYQDALDFLQSRGTDVYIVVSQMFHTECSTLSQLNVGLSHDYSRIVNCDEMNVNKTRSTSRNSSKQLSRSWSSPASRTPNGIRAVCCVLPDE